MYLSITVGEYVEKLESLYIPYGTAKQYSCCGKSLAVPQKAKHSITVTLSNFTPVYIPKRVENRDLNTSVHSSTNHSSQSWKPSKCPSTDEWVNKMWYIHTTGILFTHKTE